jgi:hypothetical protein
VLIIVSVKEKNKMKRRCSLRINKSGEAVQVTRKGRRCKFSHAVKMRHKRMHGCSGKRCLSHVRQAKSTLEARRMAMAHARKFRKKSA